MNVNEDRIAEYLDSIDREAAAAGTGTGTCPALAALINQQAARLVPLAIQFAAAQDDLFGEPELAGAGAYQE